MKIYLYCPETGVYQGEDFADSSSMKNKRQGAVIGATTIAPPTFGPGEVPVFDAAEQRWQVAPFATVAAGTSGESVPADRSAAVISSTESSTGTGGSS